MHKLSKLGHADGAKIDWRLVRKLRSSNRLEVARAAKHIRRLTAEIAKTHGNIIFEGVEPGEDALREFLIILSEDISPEKLFVQIGRAESAERMAKIIKGEAELQRH